MALSAGFGPEQVVNERESPLRSFAWRDINEKCLSFEIPDFWVMTRNLSTSGNMFEIYEFFCQERRLRNRKHLLISVFEYQAVSSYLIVR